MDIDVDMMTDIREDLVRTTIETIATATTIRETTAMTVIATIRTRVIFENEKCGRHRNSEI